MVLQLPCGRGIDWWALGIAIYEMLAGEPPFCDSPEYRLEDKIINHKILFPRWISSPAALILSRVSTIKIKTEKSEGTREWGYDILAFP
jgi:serine/threonine protein kinase